MCWQRASMALLAAPLVCCSGLMGFEEPQRRGEDAGSHDAYIEVDDGGICAEGSCKACGETIETVARSCLEIMRDCAPSNNGPRWVTLGSGSPRHLYCDFQKTAHDPGGWTLWAKTAESGSMNWTTWTAGDYRIADLVQLGITNEENAWLSTQAFDEFSQPGSPVSLRVRMEDEGYSGYYIVPVVTTLSTRIKAMRCASSSDFINIRYFPRTLAGPFYEDHDGPDRCGAEHILCSNFPKQGDGEQTTACLSFNNPAGERGGYSDGFLGTRTWHHAATLWFREGDASVTE